MTPGDADARDLHRACIHEFAHWAVAGHFGAAGFVTIVRSVAGRSSCGGRFQMYGDLADDEWRIVALAGTVAECFADDPGVDALAIVDYIRKDPDALSDVDAQLADGFEDRDVERCLGIVKALWREITNEADERSRNAESGSLG